MTTATAPHIAPPTAATIDPSESRTSRIAPLERSTLIALAALIAVFIAFVVALAVTRTPHRDEGHFASAGATFAAGRGLAMPMWEDWLPSMTQRMYISMPLYFMALGEWFKVFGESWGALRAFSVVWGVVLVGAWFVIGRFIGRRSSTGLVIAAMVGLNYDIINMASTRYDIMAVALSSLGLACYLSLRERNLRGAILAAQSCSAAACLSHPYGAIGGLGIVIFAIALDYKRIRLVEFLISTIPFIVGFGLWGVYISHDPAQFRAQFSSNASGRLGAYKHPLTALITDFLQRYVVLIGGWRRDLPIVSRVKIWTVFLYAAGFIGCFVTPALRRVVTTKALLVFALTAYLLLAFFESYRWYIYTIHALPVYAACVGLWLDHWMRQSSRGRLMGQGVIAALGLFTLATVAYRGRTNVHKRAYEPAVAYLQTHVKPGDLVLAGGEFGLGLGYRDHVIDDDKLGFVTGRRPQFFVISSDGDDHHKYYAKIYPTFSKYLETLLTQYKLVFESSEKGYFYKVYERVGG